MILISSEIILHQNTTHTPPQPFSALILPVPPLSRILMRIFLMKSMALYVVFDTGSEYHMNFTEKPIFISLSQKILAHS
jgi:hypothetical protein